MSIRQALAFLTLCGVLAGAGNAQAGQRTYSYDAMGNRTGATNQVRFTSAAAFAIQPRRALIGERINVLGRNFPAGQTSAVTVAFGGVNGIVHMVAPRVITVEVPVGANTGAVTVTIGGGSPLNVGTVSVQGVSVAPQVVDLDFNETRQFQVSVVGGSPGVTWSVEGIAGGNSSVGTISSSGLYTAPAPTTTGDFPFLIAARSASLGISGYAVVRPKCLNKGTISNKSFAQDTLAASYERHCYQFTGKALEHAYVACVGTTQIKWLKLRTSSGVTLATAGPGTSVKLGDYIVPADDTYTIEVLNGATAGNGYALWLDQHQTLPDGEWLFPGDSVWHDPLNWSNDAVPGPTVPVVIGDLPGSITVSVSQSGAMCASLLSDEGVTLATNGALTVDGDAQVNAPFNIAGGSLIDANVKPGSGGQRLIITANSQNRLDGVTIQGDLTMDITSAVTRIARGLRVTGTVHMIASGTSLAFEGTQQIHSGTISFEGSTGTRVLEMQTAGTLTLAPGVTIKGGRGTVGGSWWFGRAMGVVNRGTISADTFGETLLCRTDGFENQGTIEAKAGGVLDVEGYTGSVGAATVSGLGSALSLDGTDYVVNQGMTVPSNTTLTLAGSWSNASSMSVVGGTMNFGGTFKTASIGTFSNVAGVVNLIGALDNAAATLTLNGGTGSWNLLGGSITGGTVNQSGGAILTVLANGGNRLDGVTINGDLLLVDSGARVRIANGLTVNGIVQMIGSSTSLGFEGTQTLASGTILFQGTSGTRVLEMQSPGTLTVGPGVTIHGGRGSIGGSWYYGRAMTLVNQGVISADVAGTSITLATVGSSSVQNQGTLEAKNGATLDVDRLSGNLGTVSLTGTGSSLSVDGASWAVNPTLAVPTGTTAILQGGWTNTGAINVQGGTLELGGTFQTASIGTFSNVGGVVNLTGVLDNAAATLTLDGGTGSWNLVGGSITGGTVNQTGGAMLSILANSNNRLDGVQVQGDLDLSVNGARVRIANGLSVTGTVHMTGTSTSLGFEGSTTIPSATIEFQGTSGTRVLEMQTAGTLTLGPGVTIRGGRGSIGGSWYYGRAMTLVNQGVISADVSGTSITVGTITTAIVQNQGTLEATNGATLDVDYLAGNLGTTSLTGTGSTLLLDGASWVADQTLTVPTGTTATLQGGWTNTGAINVQGGTLNLGGAFQTASIGTFSNVAGVVNLTGALDNTASTLNLNGGTGSWNLVGGSITGGTVNQTGGAMLSIGANSSNRLDGVQVQGDLDLSVSGARVRIANGLDVTGTVHMTGTSTSLGFEGSQILNSATIEFTGASGTRTLEMQTPGTLTLGAGVTIRGGRGSIGGSFYWGQAMTLVNQGVISADVTGTSITLASIASASVQNQGTLEVKNGATLDVDRLSGNLGTVSLTGTGSSLQIDGASWAVNPTLAVPTGTTAILRGGWTNTGAINVQGGTLDLGGTFQTASIGTFSNVGGVVNLTGTLNNTAATLTLNGGTGSWNLIGGSITGGTVNQTGGAMLSIGANSSNRLDGVQVQGDLDLSVNGARVRIANGLNVTGTVHMTGTSTSLGFEGSTTVSSGTIELTGASGTRTLEMQTPGTLTLGPAVTIRGGRGSVGGSFYWGQAMTLVNQGVISADLSATTLTLAAASVANQGTLEAKSGGTLQSQNQIVQTAGTTSLDGGTLTATNGVSIQGGLLVGIGTINGPLTNAGEVRPGTPQGVLTLNGAYTQTAAGALTVELGGTALPLYDRLAVSGLATLNGTLNIAVVGGFTPQLNDTFNVLGYGSRSGTFATANGTNLGGGRTLALGYNANDLTLTVQ